MDRSKLRAPHDVLAAEFGRVILLFQQARPLGSSVLAFTRAMNDASASGLNWIDALEFVAAKRQHKMAEVRARSILSFRWSHNDPLSKLDGEREGVLGHDGHLRPGSRRYLG